MSEWGFYDWLEKVRAVTSLTHPVVQHLSFQEKDQRCPIPLSGSACLPPSNGMPPKVFNWLKALELEGPSSACALSRERAGSWLLYGKDPLLPNLVFLMGVHRLIVAHSPKMKGPLHTGQQEG